MVDARSTAQVQIQPEILFAHAYMVANDPRRLGALHPLPPSQPSEVAAFVARRGRTAVTVWDATFRPDVGAFEVAISRHHPRIAWLYTHPTTRATASAFCSVARKSGAVVVAAGPDARLRPAHYLRAGADAIVLGEGEQSTLDLVQRLRGVGWRPDSEVLSHIPGIAWLDPHGTLRYAAGAERVVPIAELPRPLRDLDATRIQLERWLKVRRFRALGLRSARGCPVPCGFCSNSVFGRPYRRRSPDDVVAEMRELASTFTLDRLVFTDELFAFDAHWIAEFASRVATGPTIPFEAAAHPSALTPAIARNLAAAGCVRLELDAASGSERLLRHLEWGYGAADIYRAVTAIRESKLELGLRVLVGLPGETREDLDLTFEMARLTGPHGIEVTRVDPGSPALFRKDWERVVAGRLAERASSDGVLPSVVLDAAAALLGAQGATAERGFSARIASAAGRPLLRAAVKALPGRRRH